MKFESKFGIGEIVENNTYKSDELVSSELYKVIYIVFDSESIVVGCRHPVSGITVSFREDELIGDVEYSQEHGMYVKT